MIPTQILANYVWYVGSHLDTSQLVGVWHVGSPRTPANFPSWTPANFPTRTPIGHAPLPHHPTELIFVLVMWLPRSGKYARYFLPP